MLHHTVSLIPENLYDSMGAKSFFKTSKIEFVKERAYEDQEEARREIFKYIGFYYNARCVHSTSRYMSSCDFE
jgi:transposase InsO family protein